MANNNGLKIKSGSNPIWTRKDLLKAPFTLFRVEIINTFKNIYYAKVKLLHYYYFNMKRWKNLCRMLL